MSVTAIILVKSEIKWFSLQNSSNMINSSVCICIVILSYYQEYLANINSKKFLNVKLLLQNQL